jgi:hypothetical protein
MAKGRQSGQPISDVVRPASGRQLGHVGKSLDKSKWSARFLFERDCSVTMDGPARACRADAEKDRKFIASAMTQGPRASRVEAASHAIKHLRDGGAAAVPHLPGFAGAIHGIDVGKLTTMNWQQLRRLATLTPGIVRNKKQGVKWIPKTCKELRADLFASQALPGCKVARKRDTAPSCRIGATTKKRPASRQ